ncbi:Nop domain-containing protein [Microthyrium microscopicum]|uniref:Nop domain-containing protein n=1 Tax=Microthyrium microscopicum TaxID=703497 RepID=A0A6A6U602_9PEZI|nr:Nop domain-containing protein [Microthyrium microscopicum]
MATLADELLADLMGSDSDGEDYGESAAEDNDVDEDAMDEEAGLEVPEPDTEIYDESIEREFASLITALKPVKGSAHLAQCLSDLLKSSEQNLLQRANALSSAIDDEVVAFHKTIRDHYSVRFPELESLVQNPMQYVKSVGIVANGPMDQINQAGLREFLDGSLVMAIRLEATRTSGREMTETETENVVKLVDMAQHLDEAKRFLTDYVQSRINQIAPNLTVLLGPETAAQLVSSAGGLTALAKVPACNIPAMGSKQQAHGLATNTRVRRQGHLYHSPMVQGVPPDQRNQAMRIISAKLALATRCDVVRSTPDGSTGERFKQECEERIEKLAIKAPNANTRALPAPDDKPSRKRGGRRARKAKEAYAMTDLRKAQNRMAFGKEEAEVGFGDDVQGMGMIGQSNDGRIRAMGIDQRTKAKLSKKNPGWGTETQTSGLASSLKTSAGIATSLQGHGLRASGVGTQTAGTASSISFTPFQGLELVNPNARAEMERKRKADDDRWFKSGTFTQVGGSTPKAPEAKVDSSGFKVPALPAIKRIKTTK